ncbi:hypothetical protein E3O25_11720 [Cryobacterium sp. TMT1-3]|nr:hypothetical protein E3O25_11720 [Cryobacterium sp. TMT1-3]
MTTYYEDNKEHVSRADVFDAPVMLAGFSQGGIVAAAFAENRSDTYNVVQVLTAGSPIGNFDIPHDISVIASEADPVSGADGTQNPERWETLTADNGGGVDSARTMSCATRSLPNPQRAHPKSKTNSTIFWV